MSDPQRKPERGLVRRPLLAAVLAASAIVPVPALAATEMYLKLDDVQGEANQKGHEGWINVSAFTTGIANPATGNGAGSGRASGKATCSELAATKDVDKASPVLWVATMTGKHYKSAKLEVARSSGDGASGVFLKYELEDVLVTSLDEGGARSDDRPMENISLNFARAKLTYYLQNSDGQLTPGATASIDCVRLTAQ